MDRIRTMVVGLNMGLHHAYAYHAAEGAELAWVADLDEAKAAKVAGELGCRHTTNWLEALGDVDAVSLCTPHHLHAPQAMAAIEAGKHVLLEKPLANERRQCLDLIEAAEAKGVAFMMAYIVRYLPAIRRLREIVRNEEFGKVFNADCWIQTHLPPMPDTWFARKSELGGGVLFSHGCHYVDLLVSLLGAPAQVAAVGTRSGTEWMEGEGTAHCVMRFESGAVGHLETSWGMKHRQTPALLHLHTPEALIVVDGAMSRIDVLDETGRRTVFGPVERLTEAQGTNALYQVEHFLACIRDGKRPETDGADALKSLDVIWDAYAGAGL